MKAAAVLGAFALAAGAHAATNIYTDQASFLDNLAPGHYFNDFTGVPQDLQPALSFGPVNGYSYIVDTLGTPDNLFNGPGFISTNTALESIIITFTGNPVTAVGGNFWGTDISFNAIPANINIMLSDGTAHAFSTSSPSGFAGFVSDMSISSITIGVSSPTGASVWTTLDNLYVGAAIPTPGALGLFGVAGFAAARRRR